MPKYAPKLCFYAKICKNLKTIMPLRTKYVKLCPNKSMPNDNIFHESNLQEFFVLITGTKKNKPQQCFWMPYIS